MSKLNFLLCILIPIMVNLVSCTPQNRALQDNAPAKIVHVERKKEMIKLDTDFFSLMKFLEENLPLTLQKVQDVGFSLEVVGSWGARIDYAGPPVQLNDGVLLYDIDLRELHSSQEEGTLFVISVKDKRIMRSEIEAAFGEFKLSGAPWGHSVNEVFSYAKMVGKCRMSALYSQWEKDLLLGMVFNSLELLQPQEETEN